MTEKESGQNWEQFQIEVDLDQADILVNLLGEIIPGGLVLEKNYGSRFPHELENFQGPARLIGYYPIELSQEIQTRISLILESSGREALLSEIEYSSLVNRNWATTWQERYHPLPIGNRFAVVPTWLENPFANRIPIWMDPGMAFGSGTHPTTQLSLALLEDALFESTPGEMIDVGCGSGILSIGAAKLGVRTVVGLDIDPDAVRIATENGKANGVADSVSFKEGSVSDIIGADGPLHTAPLVVANIIAPILADLFGEGLGNLVIPGGKIILSGILMEQLPMMIAHLGEGGFVLSDQEHSEDWVGLIAEKPLTH